MSVELYVYYKVADTTAARAVLARHPQVTVLRRSDEASDTPTWMEIHRGPQAEAQERQLAVELMPYLSGPRHVERFTAL